MLANEMNKLSSVSRNTNNDLEKQWEKMKEKIKETANKGGNKCTMVYGLCNEQLEEKLKENGFKVLMACQVFPHIHYGMANSATKWVIW